jgi:Flp pilus assembly pilin Flp
MNSIIFKITMLNEQIKAFRKDERGLTILEYAIGAAFICLAMGVAGATLVTDVTTFFATIGGKLTGATVPTP